MRITILTMLMLLFSGFFLNAQNGTTLEPDQNPNYMNSMRKYMDSKDDINAKQGTTEQDTYESYDRYESKIQKKINKSENKQERRLAKINARSRVVPYNPSFLGGNTFGVQPWIGTGFYGGMQFNRGLNNRFNCPPGGFNNFNPWHRGPGWGWGW